MKRTAIVLLKTLEAGAAANVAAVLMGQLAATNPTIYSQEIILDTNGTQHAGIKFSTVILRASSTAQITNFAEKVMAKGGHDNIVVFSRCGQKLNNQPDQHRTLVSSQTLQNTELLGIAVFGDEQAVRNLTKRFSVFR